MHDVAVADDRHEVLDHHAARQGDPPQVVAGQVDQHHVLGTFLLVSAQGDLVGVVLRRRGPARLGPRDRPDLRLATGHGDQGLG